MGLVLSVFFGLGLVLLTFIQRMPQAAHAGLEKFLFGQAAALMERDVAVMAVMGALTLGTIAFLWKEFKLLSFDPEFAASLGYPVRRLDMIMTTLLVIAIALGLQTVGVVLMSAMIVAPASAARQWTDRLGVMIVLSAGFGALAGIAGAVVSSATAHLPTGPTIVLCASAIAGCSLALSPNRGLFWRWLAQLRNRRRLRVELVLERLYALALQHDDPHHPHPAVVLRARDFAEAATSSTRRRMDLADAGIIRTLRELESRRWVRRVGIDDWGLTPEGLNQARQIMRGPESGAS
jgi:manganese/zinc/iron transport system permease protein